MIILERKDGAKDLEEPVQIFFLELFDNLFDITRDLIAAGDEKGIGGIDDDDVFESDGRYEFLFALNKDIFTPKVDMLAMDDGVIP